MSAVQSKINKTGVQTAAKKVEYSPLMEALTRYGYGVRGLIYIVMGLLALQVTLGKGGALAGYAVGIAWAGLFYTLVELYFQRRRQNVKTQ
jgi:hypothetical protein